jgi:hypothetical protein
LLRKLDCPKKASLLRVLVSQLALAAQAGWCTKAVLASVFFAFW